MQDPGLNPRKEKENSLKKKKDEIQINSHVNYIFWLIALYQC